MFVWAVVENVLHTTVRQIALLYTDLTPPEAACVFFFILL